VEDREHPPRGVAGGDHPVGLGRRQGHHLVHDAVLAASSTRIASSACESCGVAMTTRSVAGRRAPRPGGEPADLPGTDRLGADLGVTRHDAVQASAPLADGSTAMEGPPCEPVAHDDRGDHVTSRIELASPSLRRARPADRRTRVAAGRAPGVQPLAALPARPVYFDTAEAVFSVPYSRHGGSERRQFDPYRGVGRDSRGSRNPRIILRHEFAETGHGHHDGHPKPRRFRLEALARDRGLGKRVGPVGLAGNAFAAGLAGGCAPRPGPGSWTGSTTWSSAIVAGLGRRLHALGYERRTAPTRSGARPYAHRGGLFPRVAVRAGDGPEVREVAIKVESVAAFSRAHDLGLDIVGYPLGPYRIGGSPASRRASRPSNGAGYLGFDPFPGELARGGR
jgi:hypothetical protein